MATRRQRTDLGAIRTLFNLGGIGELTDGQLLERFSLGGEVAELAFAALVERHGPVVRHACQSILGDEHEAEDAFQATFLVLVRKARGLWVRDSLGPWLHEVACRAARRARTASARRSANQRVSAESAAVEFDGSQAEDAREVAAIVHEELGRMADRYRALLVLCDLEGRTHEQAARHLGCPVGTVKSRLARGRKKLRDRLTRRGVDHAGAMTIGGLTPPSRMLVEATTRAAIQASAGKLAAGAVPAAVIGTMETVFQELLMHKLKVSTVTLIAIGVLAGGLSWSGLRAAAGHPGGPQAASTGRPAQATEDALADNLRRAPDAGLRGRWEVLYMGGTAAGKREGYPIPGLIVPITETTINLPGLTGNPRSPMSYRGGMSYTVDPGGQQGVIDLGLGENPQRTLRGIYRLRDDILTICYGEPGRERPATFVADQASENLIVLRRDHPEKTSTPLPGGSPPPVTQPGGTAILPTTR